MSWLAALALPAVLWAAGARLLGDPWPARGPRGAIGSSGSSGSSGASGASRSARAPLALLAGILAFYLALSLLTLFGVPWTRWTLAAALALLFAIPRRGLAGAGGPPGERSDAAASGLGWGTARPSPASSPSP